jgi:ATP-dependent Clp protease ATP-binding subunit ClpC
VTAVASAGDWLGAILFLVLLAVAVAWAGSRLRQLAEHWRRRREDAADPHSGTAAAAVPGGRDLSPEQQRVLRAEADRLDDRFEHGAANRDVLLADDVFRRALRRARSLELSTEVLVSLAASHDAWVARLALVLLSERDDVPDRWLPMAVRRLSPAPWDLAGLFLLSLERAPGDVIGNVLPKLDDVLDGDLAALITSRVESGRETVDEELMRRHVPLSMTDEIQGLVDTYELPASVEEAFREWLENSLDFGEAGRYVKVWSRPFEQGETRALLEGRRAEVADELVAALQESPPRSVVLVGDHGIGKTALARSALERLPDGWTVFEAGATQINADAMYVGQLEGRIEDLVNRLHGRQVIWVFPALEEALWAGTYSNHPTGLLDALLPHVESGTIRMVAEATPASYELLAAKRPRIQSAFRALRLRPLAEEETVQVLEHALASRADGVAADRAVLAETCELAQQFLPGIAQPGGALRLLRSAADDAAERGAPSFDTSDVLSALATLSGLPLALLDASRPLDLHDVSAFFHERVLGQPEAVGSIVDRIALVKAGLTDPTRPLGVFLFVGPTGTGKTELAKTLAQFMFGSENRLVRIDMSEYQTPNALERLLADTSVENTGAPLIAAVRKDPFSVVLLDEFEKAAAPVWDLFLQVFDDGRLTDRSGRTTDFRRCIIILTSNVGSALQVGPGLGFTGVEQAFNPGEVERALRRAFRPEFLNRIDQLIVFEPFGRAEMRLLLDKELEDVLRRRGIRGKPWAIEVDESAATFLLEEGFSPTLGARPLKRAVEQHLLTPLARAMVGAESPEGDQFLFVTAQGGRIEVRFVGLDENEPAEPSAGAPDGEPLEPSDLRGLLRSGRFPPAAQQGLLAELGEIDLRLRNEILERKQVALELVSAPGFWELDDRFEVLAEIEYLDRFEAACATASKLGARLRRQLDRSADDGERSDADLCALLATRLYALGNALDGIDASAPFEVFLRLRLVASQERGGADEREFLTALVDMYLGWSQRRGMQAQVLARSPNEVLLHVGGLGCSVILALEAGLHVLDMPDTQAGPEARDGRSVERVTVGVQVAAAAPGDRTLPDALLRQARDAFASSEAPAQVVRRYRASPSSLVRDAARGYRTGRLDSVLAGDFDLFAGSS